MKLPDDIITLLRHQQFSALLHDGIVLDACRSASNQTTLDLSAILISADLEITARHQLMYVLNLITQKFPIIYLHLGQNNIYGMGSRLMQGLHQSSLLYLDLSNCGLDGEDLDFSALAKGCPKLYSLILEGNDLRPWQDTSTRQIPVNKTDGFRVVIQNLLSLVHLKNLRILNLSKTNIDIINTYLGAVIWVLISNRVLEQIELRGIGFSKKAFAYCIVACGQMRRASRKPVTIVCEGSRNSDFFKQRIQRWNQDQQKKSQEHTLTVLSLFNKYERSTKVHHNINARSDPRALAVDLIAQCEDILVSLSTDVHRLWGENKRKESMTLSPRAKRQRQQISTEQTSQAYTLGESETIIFDYTLTPCRLFHYPQKKLKSGSNGAYLIHDHSIGIENINPQSQSENSREDEVHKRRLLDLPQDIRIKIAGYLGEGQCQVIMR